MAATSTPASSRYVDAKYGFSFSYPASWPNTRVYADGVSPAVEDVYASSEAVPSPLQLQVDSIWITVRVIANPDGASLQEWAARHPVSSSAVQIRNSAGLIVAGVSAVQQVEDDTTGGAHEAAYQVVTYVAHGDLMYVIAGLALTQRGFSQHADDYQTIVKSFRFE